MNWMLLNFIITQLFIIISERNVCHFEQLFGNYCFLLFILMINGVLHPAGSRAKFNTSSPQENVFGVLQFANLKFANAIRKIVWDQFKYLCICCKSFPDAYAIDEYCCDVLLTLPKNLSEHLRFQFYRKAPCPEESPYWNLRLEPVRSWNTIHCQSE